VFCIEIYCSGSGKRTLEIKERTDVGSVLKKRKSKRERQRIGKERERKGGDEGKEGKEEKKSKSDEKKAEYIRDRKIDAPIHAPPTYNLDGKRFFPRYMALSAWQPAS
jgi:hypothetical protein